MIRSINPSELWRRNHPWAPIYSFLLNHPRISVPGARVMMRTDLRMLYRATEEIGGLPPGSAVLDVPCGGGVALRGVRKDQQLRYVAADIAEAMLDRTSAEASRRGIGVELVAADIAAMPFADGEFDLCVSFTGLHCVPDPEAAVAELGRVVRSGGRISGSLVLADVPVHHRPALAAARLSGLMGPSATSGEITRWLGEAGFSDVSLTRSGDIGYFTGTHG